MNWRDLKRTDRFSFEMIDPSDLDFVRGELEGVILSGSSLTEGYDTDTRISGKLKVVDSNYIENSMIRIHHYIDEWGYHNELGTFFVINDDMDYEQGVWSGTLDLRSALYAWTVDFWTWHYTIPGGIYTKTALEQFHACCVRPLEVLPTVSNILYESPVVYEFGDKVLKTLTDICDKCNARLEVDGHGKVLVTPYVAPFAKSPVLELDYDARDSLIISDVSRSFERSKIPSRVGVISKDGQNEITAAVDASPASLGAAGRRGYSKVDIHKPSDLSPKTWQAAQSYAESKLAESLQLPIEYEFSTLYIPYGPGCTVDLIIEGEKHRCLIESKDIALDPGMPCKLNLKVV